VVVVLCLLGGRGACQADDPSFVPIFDGATLAGWEGDPGFWRVEEGAIVGETTAENPTRGNTFLIWRQGLLDDFELTLRYRLTGGNSGIQYRSHDRGDFVVSGYQADFEAGTQYSGILYEEKGRGILCPRGQRVTIGPDGSRTTGEAIADSAELQAAIRPDDWNEYRIVAEGPRLRHFINGRLMAETVDHQTDARALQGVLALQLHQGPPMKAEFKDIRLKRLPLSDGRKKLLMVAGAASHGPGEHEHRAGVLLLKKCLDEFMARDPAAPLLTEVATGGWPDDPTAFANADAVFFFADGGGGHPVLQSHRLAHMAALARRGVGIACLHYAVEVPKEKGGPEFLDWLGGYFEPHWSVNPHWTLNHTELAEGHPICRGVQPFETQDEWYYHMRFRDPPEGLTMILTAVPPDSTREGPDHSHHGNPTVRANRGAREVLAWAFQRPEGGRGFGCTGGHFHRNWESDDFRRLMLNALVWVSGLEVPDDGVACTVTAEDLAANLDPKPPRP
jgi:type 1 glutamine amidotransferase